jgi:Zn-dependent metalloprotease
MKKIIIAVLMFCGTAIYGQDMPNTQNPLAEQNKSGDSIAINNRIKLIEQEFYGKISLKLNDNGTPSELAGNINKGITAPDPEGKTYQLFELHKDVFGILNPREELINYKVAGTWDDGNIQGVEVSQQYNGIKVIGAGYNVFFNEDGSLMFCCGQLYPEAEKVNTTPSITKEQAKEKALNYPDAKDAPFKSISQNPNLVIVIFQGIAHLAWKTCIDHYACYYIEAHSGDVLYRETSIIPTAPLGLDGAKSLKK